MNLVTLWLRSQAVRRLYWIVTNSFAFMIVLCLYIVKPFKLVKIFLVPDRIGNLACNTDLFLRRLQLGIVRKKGIWYVGIINTNPCNKQLLKMFQRKLFIIQLPRVIFILLSGQLFNKKAVLRKSRFYQPLPFNTNEYYEFNNAEPSLCFTASEGEKGEKLLNKMGIDDKSWFVCLHSRDVAYASSQFKYRDWSFHDFRDSNIENYLEAAKYLASCGGFVVRMGYIVAEKLPDLNNSRIVDYASYYRTDFGDVYLAAKCKFFLGTVSGILMVSEIFHVPTAQVNLIPLRYPPLRKDDLFIPKKIWSIEKERLLTFREILESGVVEYWYSNVYAEAGLEAVENTADEILDLAKEMNERLDGTFGITEEDEELQKRFHFLIQPHHHCYGTPARIGSKFLRQNRELLE